LRALRGERVAGSLLHAAYVRVDRENVAAEGEVADRGRGVRPDSWKLCQVVWPSVRRDDAGGAVKVEAASVVTEPLPLADDVRRRCVRERVDGRPPLKPGEEARDDALDLRLLQHDLGDEDRVRVARLAPGKITALRREPSQKHLLHGRQPTRPDGGYDYRSS